ncbi:hypothetical protein, partial [Escherichia coli]|uniref:hypothetical protein n=1 Tax=Escherichia coli TaxID=562 RepID=UPI001BC82F48
RWRRCAGVIFFAIRFLTFAYKGRACRMAWFTTAGNAPSPDAYIVFEIKITDRYITCVYLSALKLLRR